MGGYSTQQAVRRIVESVVKAKKYVIILAIFQPYVAGSIAAAYLIDGQFSPNKKAMISTWTDLAPREVALTAVEPRHDRCLEVEGLTHRRPSDLPPDSASGDAAASPLATRPWDRIRSQCGLW